MNLAVRLAVRAPWNEIWCDEATAAQFPTGFTLDDLGRIPLKGIQNPLRVYGLIADEQISEDEAGGLALVGREVELARLEAALAPLTDNKTAGVILVSGEAGIGKSRLVEESKRTSAAFCTWLKCPADQILRRSLDPFRRSLRHWFDLHNDGTHQDRLDSFNRRFEALVTSLPGSDPVAAEIRTELERTRSFLAALVALYWPGSLYERLEPELRHENTLAAYGAFIRALTRHAPVVIHVEDMQWLDADSVEMVEFLIAHAKADSVAIVLTVRNDGHDQPPMPNLPVDVTLTQIDLQGLTVAGVGHYMAQKLGGPIANDAFTFVYDRTNGNPFYVEQLAVDLQERGLLQFSAAQGEVLEAEQWILDYSGTFDSVPASLSAVLIARLDRLPSRVKEVIQTASVLGQEFETQVLTRVLVADDGLEAVLQIAVAHQIWAPTHDRSYAFRHRLFRDAAYDMQMRARLRQVHESGRRSNSTGICR